MNSLLSSGGGRVTPGISRKQMLIYQATESIVLFFHCNSNVKICCFVFYFFLFFCCFIYVLVNMKLLILSHVVTFITIFRVA